MVVQRTGVGIIAVRANLNIGIRLRADDALHGVNLVLNIAAQGGDWPGYVFEREKLLRINRALPDKFVIDVGEETFAELDARAGEHKRLEGDVGQMDILLQRGGGFDFDQIPRIAGDRHKDVHASVAAVVRKGGFI